jgi:hypothetical protein
VHNFAVASHTIVTAGIFDSFQQADGHGCPHLNLTDYRLTELARLQTTLSHDERLLLNLCLASEWSKKAVDLPPVQAYPLALTV